MARAITPMGIIHRAAQDAPELSLIAAMVRLAVEDAAGGDPSARQWLGSPACAKWLAWLASGDADPAAVQARILAGLPASQPYQAALDLADGAA